jgi:hypothetical protein
LINVFGDAWNSNGQGKDTVQGIEKLLAQLARISAVAQSVQLLLTFF